MPRRSGTTTVWSAPSIAVASGAHMSPVSAKPCSMTTGRSRAADAGVDGGAAGLDLLDAHAGWKGLNHEL